MNRRSFLPVLTSGVSGSFVLGAAGGALAGTAGTAYGTTALRPWARESHSQQGEDLIVQSICDALAITQPTYLDIGAADPCQDNNTYLLYKKGCRGVLVEPNPAFCRKLRSRRPGDTVLNIGVGITDQTEADYYMLSGRDGDYLNSFSKAQVDEVVARSEGTRRIARVLKMPLVNINRIIEAHFAGAPSFVSIDTEGLDLAILKTFDFERFRPAVFCVETLVIGTTRVETRLLDLMTANHYTPRGGTLANTIFVDNRLIP
jgi:FkbM family methyltransferase